MNSTPGFHRPVKPQRRIGRWRFRLGLVVLGLALRCGKRAPWLARLFDRIAVRLFRWPV